MKSQYIKLDFLTTLPYLRHWKLWSELSSTYELTIEHIGIVAIGVLHHWRVRCSGISDTMIVLVSVLSIDLCQGLFLVVAFDELARSRSLTVFSHEFDIHSLTISPPILWSCWRGVSFRRIFIFKCRVITFPCSFQNVSRSLFICLARILSTHLSQFCRWLIDWFLIQEWFWLDILRMSEYTCTIIVNGLIDAYLVPFLVSFPKFRLLYDKCVIRLARSALECFLRRLI